MTGRRSAHDLDGLAYTFHGLADRFTHLVHGRDPAARDILAELGVVELRALAVVLAELRPTPEQDGIVDRAAVYRVLNAEAGAEPTLLNEAEQVEAAKISILEGRPRRQYAQILHLTQNRAARLWERAQAILLHRDGAAA